MAAMLVGGESTGDTPPRLRTVPTDAAPAQGTNDQSPDGRSRSRSRKGTQKKRKLVSELDPQPDPETTPAPAAHHQTTGDLPPAESPKAAPEAHRRVSEPKPGLESKAETLALPEPEPEPEPETRHRKLSGSRTADDIRAVLAESRRGIEQCEE
jgi:hypothetical protein